jgi:hypothetical protein
LQLKWLEWAKQIQAISQTGLAYSKDIYDIERFEMLRNMSVEILNEYTDVEVEKIKELFANETGYATPKVDIRGVIFKENKILLVKERLDGAWALDWIDAVAARAAAAEDLFWGKQKAFRINRKALCLLGVKPA